MIKKIFSTVILVAVLIFVSSPVQAENNFDLNNDFNDKVSKLTNIYTGIVVNVESYLIVREKPTMYSREVMRIPNGAKLTLRSIGGVDYINSDWMAVAYYNGMTDVGYVNTKYIEIVR